MEKRKQCGRMCGNIRILLMCILITALFCGCARTGGETDGGQDGTTEQNGQADNTDGPGNAGQEMMSSEEEPVPEPVVFEALDLEGNTVTSDVFGESKLTMVNVWATYCNPCLQEMPHLGELAGEYDAGTFRLIGVVSDVQEGAGQETLDAVGDLVAQTGAAYTHLLLNFSLYNGMLADVTAVPTTFFVNEEGIIVGSVVGAMDKASWKEIIDGLLEEQ